MNLGERNLGAGFMKNTSGKRSTPDQMENMRLRAGDSGPLSVSSFYDETGSLPVARSLARHYQEGGKAKDPYEYKRDGDKIMTRKKDGGEWIEAKGKAREAIINDGLVDEAPRQSNAPGQYVAAPPPAEGGIPKIQGGLQPAPSTGSQVEEPQQKPDSPYDLSGLDQGPTLAEGLENINKDEGNWRQRLNPNTGEYEYSLFPIQPVEEMNKAIDAAAVERNKESLGSPDQRPFTTGEGSDGYVSPSKEATPEKEIPIQGGATPVQGGGGSSRFINNPMPPAAKVQGLGYQPMAQKPSLDMSSIEGYQAPAAEEAPDLGPGWWDENRRDISRGASNVAAGLLNVAPNFANIRNYKNMPGVRSSNLARAVKTEAPSMEASRQAIIAQGRNMANVTGNSPQSNLGQQAAAMAGTQSSLSQLGGQEAQIQAQTDARNAQASNQVNAMNTQVMNQNLQQQQARELAQMRGIAGEWGQVAGKSLGFLGDLNKQKLDDERMDLTRQRYNMQGQMDRAALKQFEKTGMLPEYYNKQR